MKTHFTVALSILAGVAIGALAVQHSIGRILRTKHFAIMVPQGH